MSDLAERASRKEDARTTKDFVPLDPILPSSFTMSHRMSVEAQDTRVAGLDPATVDEALEHLWQLGRIEGTITLGSRNPSLDSIRRVLPDRERLWGEDGRF